MTVREKPSTKKTARNDSRPKETKSAPKKASPTPPIQPMEAALSETNFHERVSQRAYELFERRGGEPGHEMEDWLEAERLVRQEMSQGSSRGKAKKTS